MCIWGAKKMNPLHSNCTRLFTAIGLVFGIYANAVQVKVSEAPSDALEMTLAAIHSANHSIFMNAYELSSADIANAIVDRVKAGVTVQILEEGQPVGGLSKPGKAIQQQIVDAINTSGDGHFFLMTSKVKSKRRYRFDHAKYAVIDGQDLLIGSENYSPTGNPSTGSVGNRGWEVIVTDTSLASQYQSIFAIDADTSHGDVEELTDNRVRAFRQISANPLSHFLDSMMPAAPTGNRSFIDALPGFDASGITKVTSPDTSLSGLSDLLSSAKTSIDLELMTFTPSWTKAKPVSPLYDAVLAAARRGVRLRVLVNDERVFGGTDTSKMKNFQLVDQLNAASQSESLNLEARIADLKAMGVDYIHNKGALVDGNQTLISSINWDENSVEHNREAAVVINCTDINKHYSALFNSDWDNSSNSK